MFFWETCGQKLKQDPFNYKVTTTANDGGLTYFTAKNIHMEGMPDN